MLDEEGDGELAGRDGWGEGSKDRGDKRRKRKMRWRAAC